MTLKLINKNYFERMPIYLLDFGKPIVVADKEKKHLNKNFSGFSSFM